MYTMLVQKSIMHVWEYVFASLRHAHWKAQKEATLLWSIIYKAVAVNKWCGTILMEIDKSRPHCSPQVGGIGGAHVLELSPRSTWVAIRCQHHLATLSHKRNLGVRKSFSMLQFMFDQPLCKTLRRMYVVLCKKRSSVDHMATMKYLVFNNLRWPVEKSTSSHLGCLVELWEDWMKTDA